MDEALEHIIRQALADAHAARWDYLTQTERAVLEARPDMPASEALSAVEAVLILAIISAALAAWMIFASRKI